MPSPASYSDKPLIQKPVGSSDLINSRYIRKLIAELFKSQSEFEGFCLDYFPHVHKSFTAGMDKIAKVNLLLEYQINDLMPILLALQEEFPRHFGDAAPIAKESTAADTVAEHLQPVVVHHVPPAATAGHTTPASALPAPSSSARTPRWMNRVWLHPTDVVQGRVVVSVFLASIVVSIIIFRGALGVTLGNLFLLMGANGVAGKVYEHACSPKIPESCFKAGQVHERNARGIRANRNLRQETQNRALFYYELACQSESQDESVKRGCFAAGMVSRSVIESSTLLAEDKRYEGESAILYLERACKLGFLAACLEIKQ